MTAAKKKAAPRKRAARRRTKKPIIMTERDHELTFVLRVKGYGKTEVVLRSALLRLCSALHLTFGEGRWSLSYSENGTGNLHPITYDSKAHDGEHVDHAITIKMDDEVVEGAVS